MKKQLQVINALLAVSFIAILFSCNLGSKETKKHLEENSTSTTSKTLELKTTIALPNVKGGFDLMAVDLQGQRLFVSAQDNHTLEVIDLKNNSHIKSIPNFNEPKWVVYLPKTNRIYVATGKDGKVTVLDGDIYNVINTFTFKEKCNNLRFDEASDQLFVGVGDTFGSIGIIDVAKNKIIDEIPLSDYPKQFEIDGNLIYVNVTAKNCIQVVDRTAKKVIATWPVTEAKGNVPMALDREHQRLFIGCEPGKFVVFSTKTEKPVTSLTMSKDADGIYYDSQRNLVYVSCAEGTIEVIKQDSPDQYHILETIPSVEGAGTSLYSAELDLFILAVPQAETQKAEIRIYQPTN